MAFNAPKSIIKPQDIFKTIRAFLVITSEQTSSRPDAENRRDELASLCNTVGINVGGWTHFTIRSFNSATYIGSGQVQNLASMALDNECNLVVFNTSISPRVQRNLETLTELCIVDRQEIILQIFANRAATREARLQVELAQLQYSMPRLTRKWGELSQQRGGVKGSKGSGEKKLELDKRQAQERMTRLKKEIKEIEKQRNVQRRNRLLGDIKNIAIVGYTNSGKSTLLNRISDSQVLAEDKLFATLDPTTRRVRLPNGNYVLLTDTVGFVNDLPHELVNAFRSTLEEAVLADMLLIVLDSSRADFMTCWNTTKEVLESLNAFEKPKLVLLNKTDLVTEENFFSLEAFKTLGYDSISISVTKDQSMGPLLHKIEEMLQ
ncbi:MAG: GTPase HflX [Sphaerochaetaceae bacterium]|nr:GTPase HflX [Sphaerochaetaceae bacterium]